MWLQGRELRKETLSHRSCGDETDKRIPWDVEHSKLPLDNRVDIIISTSIQHSYIQRTKTFQLPHRRR